MKKILTFTLTLGIVLLLSACSNKEVAEVSEIEPTTDEVVATEVTEISDCNDDLDCFLRENTKVCTKATFVSKESPEKKLEIEPQSENCLLTSYGFIEEGKKYVCGMPTGEGSLQSWNSFIEDINQPENGRCSIENL